MKPIHALSLLPAGALLLLGMFLSPLAAHAQVCANNTGTCTTASLCASSPDRQDIGPDASCADGYVCCLLPEGVAAGDVIQEGAAAERPPAVTAPEGTRVTEEAGKGQTTVGYGLKNPLGSRTVPQIIGAIISWFSGLAGALFMLYLIWGGIEWMTSAGSPEKLKSAQRKIIYAIFGMVIVVLSYFIVDAIIGFTNIPPGT